MNNIYSNPWWYCIQGTHLRGAVTNITNKKNAIPEVWGVRQLGTLEVHKRKRVKRSSKDSWFQPFWGDWWQGWERMTQNLWVAAVVDDKFLTKIQKVSPNGILLIQNPDYLKIASDSQLNDTHLNLNPSLLCEAPWFIKLALTDLRWLIFKTAGLEIHRPISAPLRYETGVVRKP